MACNAILCEFSLAVVLTDERSKREQSLAQVNASGSSKLSHHSLNKQASTLLPTNSSHPRDHLKSNWTEGEAAAFQITRKGKSLLWQDVFHSPHIFCLLRLINPPPAPANGLCGGGGKSRKEKHSGQIFCSSAPPLAGAAGLLIEVWGARACEVSLLPRWPHSSPFVQSWGDSSQHFHSPANGFNIIIEFYCKPLLYFVYFQNLPIVSLPNWTVDLTITCNHLLMTQISNINDLKTTECVSACSRSKWPQIFVPLSSCTISYRFSLSSLKTRLWQPFLHTVNPPGWNSLLYANQSTHLHSYSSLMQGFSSNGGWGRKIQNKK